MAAILKQTGGDPYEPLPSRPLFIRPSKDFNAKKLIDFGNGTYDQLSTLVVYSISITSTNHWTDARSLPYTTRGSACT